MKAGCIQTGIGLCGAFKMKQTIMASWTLAVACAAVAIGLAGPAQATTDAPPGGLTLSVLSSAPEHVSGGDARIQVKAAPGVHDIFRLWVLFFKIV